MEVLSTSAAGAFPESESLEHVFRDEKTAPLTYDFEVANCRKTVVVEPPAVYAGGRIC